MNKEEVKNKIDRAKQKMIEHKPNENLIAGYHNFSPVRGVSVWKGEGGELPGPFFSSFACHTCGTKEAGNRFYCTATIGTKHSNEREKLEICEDCYLYFFT